MNPKFAALVGTLAPKLERARRLWGTASGYAAVWGLPFHGSRAAPVCRPLKRAAWSIWSPLPPRSNSSTGSLRISASAGSHRLHPRDVSRGGREPRWLDARPNIRRRIHSRQGTHPEMEYRYVEEADQNCQALLEIYCAIVLETPYNDFGTH
jgi:hypothetical protein